MPIGIQRQKRLGENNEYFQHRKEAEMPAKALEVVRLQDEVFERNIALFVIQPWRDKTWAKKKMEGTITPKRTREPQGYVELRPCSLSDFTIRQLSAILHEIERNYLVDEHVFFFNGKRYYAKVTKPEPEVLDEYEQKLEALYAKYRPLKGEAKRRPRQPPEESITPATTDSSAPPADQSNQGEVSPQSPQ